MPCYRPYTAYRSKSGKSSTGKHPIVFNKKLGLKDSEIKIACGQCYGCRMEKSRIWAMRCMHEAKLHDFNYYLTLTYDDEHLAQLPKKNSLSKRHLQLFWKRLRKAGYKFRYYACGEYGEQKERPHYHAILFNLPIPDLKYHSTTRSGHKLYNAESINEHWPHGFVVIGNVTFESAAYVARYVMKKRSSKTKHELDQHYERLDTETGELYNLEPEFQVMSRRPGIGTEFYQTFKKDMYQAGTDGKVYIRGGVSCKPPNFYESKYELESNDNFRQIERIKERRRKSYEDRAGDNTEARLLVKESISKNIATKRLPRNI